ncbi:hypothetical protein [Polyangium sp. 15x6]|uniref:hypothetical protein n=1 Tax=Polyangium sp. 15x6 TaxID=3042687 RepID=UPI00249BF84E|nr:hypothetical protein [Polyangium sp. 15x6]MDI3287394.1 hypothetical protein [Polyangium sp. 15x6]
MGACNAFDGLEGNRSETLLDARQVSLPSRRAAVRGAHTRLRNFKRDLKNLGLTEAQIIPDASAAKKPGRRRNLGKISVSTRLRAISVSRTGVRPFLDEKTVP